MPTVRHYGLAIAVVVLFVIAFTVTFVPPFGGRQVNALSASQQTAEAPITRDNWQKHPQIVSIRALVAQYDVQMDNGDFEGSKREFEYCEPYVDTSRRIAVDKSGRVRFYASERGSEDSSLKFNHYYDRDGHLRFVFITGGAVNGARLEHRIYFDRRSNRIWEDQKYVKLPRYTFPDVWPIDQLQVSDPATAFAAASPCPEMKPRAKKVKT